MCAAVHAIHSRGRDYCATLDSLDQMHHISYSEMHGLQVHRCKRSNKKCLKFADKSADDSSFKM